MRDSKRGQARHRGFHGRLHLLLELPDTLSRRIEDKGSGGELIPEICDGAVQGSHFVCVAEGGELYFLPELEDCGQTLLMLNCLRGLARVDIGEG